MSHLLAGHAPEVPIHVKEGLQKALQTVPVSDYSPLDHHSGALDRITVSPCYVSITVAQWGWLPQHVLSIVRIGVS